MKPGQGEPVRVPAGDLNTLERKLLADHGLLESVESDEAQFLKSSLGELSKRGRRRRPRAFRGRTLDRLQAVQALFQAEGAHRSVAAVLDGDYLLLDIDDRENLVTTGPIRPWARELALGADEHRAEIDEVLGRVATGWDVSRMTRMDRNILRVALYELLYEDGSNAAVVGNEAVELAKALGTDDSRVFVNGVIGAVAREMEAAAKASEDGAAGAQGADPTIVDADLADGGASGDGPADTSNTECPWPAGGPDEAQDPSGSDDLAGTDAGEDR